MHGSAFKIQSCIRRSGDGRGFSVARVAFPLLPAPHSCSPVGQATGELAAKWKTLGPASEIHPDESRQDEGLVHTHQQLLQFSDVTITGVCAPVKVSSSNFVPSRQCFHWAGDVVVGIKLVLPIAMMGAMSPQKPGMLWSLRSSLSKWTGKEECILLHLRAFQGGRCLRKSRDVVVGVKRTMKVWFMGLFAWGSQVWCSCLVISKHEQTITAGFGVRGPEVGKGQTKKTTKLGTEEWPECHSWLLFVSLRVGVLCTQCAKCMLVAAVATLAGVCRLRQAVRNGLLVQASSVPATRAGQRCISHAGMCQQRKWCARLPSSLQHVWFQVISPDEQLTWCTHVKRSKHQHKIEAAACAAVLLPFLPSFLPPSNCATGLHSAARHHPLPTGHENK
eukprot:jgi/Bigna1/80336/fgenesh1_pg.70_\